MVQFLEVRSASLLKKGFYRFGFEAAFGPEWRGVINGGITATDSFCSDV